MKPSNPPADSRHDVFPGQTRSLNILVIDDEPSIRELLLTCVQMDGHQAVGVGSSAEAKAALSQRVFDLCFLDLRLGTENGLELIRPLRQAAPWLRIILMTAFAGIDSAVDAIKLGATNYLSKPLTPAQVRLACLELSGSRGGGSGDSAVKHLPGQLVSSDDFETSCPAMRLALDVALNAAPSNRPVLIRGEPGTGKRTLARAIHEWSGRADRPLCFAGCRAPTPLKVEYEWFGVVRSVAKSGADKPAGRIAAAGNGTAVIEEVGDLPESVQPKLLRLLKTGEYQRTGESAVQHSEARFIITASTNIEEKAAAGVFSDDLLNEMSVVTVNLPPLRQRGQDIIEFVETYTRVIGRQQGKPWVRFNDAAMAAMVKHSWPGNIRELKNFIERAVVLSDAEQIDMEKVPLEPLNNFSSVAIGDQVPLQRVEEMHIRAVMAASPTIEAAAMTLGMDTVTLWRWRKRYGI